MDVFHCNFCGHLPHIPGIDARPYFITNCGHTLCGNCATNGAGGLKDQCTLCHVACKTVEVNQGSVPEIKAYFMDPCAMLADTYKKFGKIANFQKVQTKHFQTLVTRMHDMFRKTAAENVTLKRELASCQEENQALKIKIETIQQDHQSWIGRGSPAGNGNDSGTGFQLNLGRQVSFDEETPSRRSPAFPGGLFTGDQRGSSSEQNFFVTPSNSVTSNRGSTPFTMRTPCDLVSGHSTPASRMFRTESGNLGGVFKHPSSIDRATHQTSNSGGNSRRNAAFSPGFCPAPGAGRPGARNPSRSPQPNGSQTPDLATRLRGLHW